MDRSLHQPGPYVGDFCESGFFHILDESMRVDRIVDQDGAAAATCALELLLCQFWLESLLLWS